MSQGRNTLGRHGSTVQQHGARVGRVQLGCLLGRERDEGGEHEGHAAQLEAGEPPSERLAEPADSTTKTSRPLTAAAAAPSWKSRGGWPGTSSCHSRAHEE